MAKNKKAYNVFWADEGIEVNGIEFQTSYTGEFYTDNTDKIAQYVEAALNEIDPGGDKIGAGLLPVLASVLYGQHIQILGISERIVLLEKSLASHYHAETVVVKGIK